MSESLQHRGPDGYGFMLYSSEQGIRCWINREIPADGQNANSVGFAHQRLSIVDLSTDSLQPMVDECNRFCLVYNGEIYNYIELRAELEALGYSFKTSGDTEVLLRAFEAWGPDCMQRLNGMWAFALLDVANQRVIFSRDRFGVKPLYYKVQNGTLFFASEIKGLLAASGVTCQPNEKAVAKFLLTGIVDDAEETFFDGIFQLPAAHWAAVSLKTDSLAIEPKPYWSFPPTEFQGTERAAIKRFQELFFDSVKIHLRSDVPVGTCLSGGLDSSSIVCVADLLRKSNRMPNFSHLAFGYCSGDEEFDEKKYMDIAARAASAQMNYITFDQDQFESKLSQIVAQQDEPFGSASIVAQWFVFERAKKAGITVMLDGQGADETLAGYHFYFPGIALNLFHNREILRLLSLKFLYKESMGDFPVSNSTLVRSLIPGSLMKPLRLAKRLLRVNALQVTTASVDPTVVNLSLSRQFVADGNGEPSAPPLNDVLQHHVQSLVLPALLRYEDRNSMAHSIEARVPFLDYRLVEHLFSLPGDWKIKGVTTKNILREAMKDILPKPINNRKDKIGFKSAPNLTFEFARKRYDTFLKNETEFEKDWFNSQGVAETLNCEQTVSNEFILWRVLGIKLWVRHFWG